MKMGGSGRGRKAGRRATTKDRGAAAVVADQRLPPLSVGASALSDYSFATMRLREIRESGSEEEEEAWLTEMDAIWYRMTERERDVWQRIYGAGWPLPEEPT